MKKLALTNLMLLTAIKSVSACSVAVDPNNPNYDPIAENNFYGAIYFYSSIFLILAIIVSYFLSGRKRLWFVIVTITSVFLMIPILFVFGIMLKGCGNISLGIIKWYFIFLLFLFTFQIVSWIIRKRRLKETLP
jgi:hypothetical protein